DDAAARERLRVEAQAAARLDHPNICTIYEVGETQDARFFIVMPFYHGETIAARLTRGPLAVAEVVSVALQTARGLAKAHDSGIIHRDIKPANLIVNADGVLKILDFGIAKLSGAAITLPGATPGTTAYMSPEQTRGDRLTAATDIWSLGVVLYEMLTGAKPFGGGDARAVRAAICAAEPEPVATRRADVPPSLDQLVRASLAKDAAQRPSSASAVAGELEAIGALLGVSVAGVSAARSRDERERSDAPATLSTDGEGRDAAIVALRVSGYAELLESRGSADAMREVDRVRALVAETAERFGGVLNGFDESGGAVLFGVPHAREDDCVRAARAAAVLVDGVCDSSEGDAPSSTAPLRLHVGLDAGRVIVRPLDRHGASFHVAGPAVDLAARLADLSPAGRVWIGPRCRRLLEPSLRLTLRDGMLLPDGDRTVSPYELAGESDAQTRLEAALRHGDLTPYTARDHELSLVRACLDDASAGAGRFVVVLGEAGMGKSRLLHELLPVVQDRGATVLRGRCLSYGAATAYLPFIDVVRDALGLAAHGPATTAAALARVREGMPELDEFLSLYLHLLSLPGAELRIAPQLQGEKFRIMAQEAIAALLTATSRQHPTVLLLEDWHWVDDASHAVLTQIAELVARYALLVVVTCRPGYVGDWGPVAPHATVNLGPLAESSTAELLRAVLGARDVPAPLVTLLHERTGGNPFFLEEICQELLEDGALRVANGAVELAHPMDALRLPGTVQAVIRARLDRLDSATRDTLLVASVVGREFGRDVLERTLDDASRLNAAIRSLKAAGLVEQTGVAPRAIYRFRHVLMQEAAYATLLEHRRRVLHGRVGAAMEAVGDAMQDDRLERMAHHFERAEVWDKAVRYAVLAAERASTLAEFPEAMQLIERARTWLARLPETTSRRERSVDLLLRQERLGETLGLRDRQQVFIDEMFALLGADGNCVQLAEVYLRQGDLHTLMRRFDAADDALQQCVALRRALGDAVGVRHALRSLGLLRWHQGRDEDALACIEEALAIDRERGDTIAVVGDLSNLGYVLKGMGYYETAEERLLEGIDLSERILAGEADAGVKSDAAVKQHYLVHNLANVYRQLGQSERALELMRRAAERSGGDRLPIQLSYHYTSIAHLCLVAGRIEESLEHYRAAVDFTRRANFVPGLSLSLRMLGEVLATLGRRDEALPLLEEAAGLFAQLGNRTSQAELWESVAQLHEAEHRDPDALSAWARARALRRDLRDVAGELTAAEGLGRVTRRHVSEPALAIPHYADAAAMAATVGERRTEGRLRNVIGILEYQRKSYAAALEQYQLAAAVFDACGDADGLGLALNSIGATLRSMGRHADARTSLARALEHNERAARPELLGHTLGMLGAVEMEAGAADRAVPYLERSLAIRVEQGDTRGEGWMCYELSRAAVAGAMPDRARSMLESSARAAKECGDAELSDACDRLRRTAGL
ncbi:MAG TPA: tetratricopeptide repeat protein, partial [Burkholderiales bacterium]|nr:tetratricopeptide repeat protein [Burkholderiales bacterium]